MSHDTYKTPPYTIEELIAELTSIAANRGWGTQSLTNIREIRSTSGDRTVRLLTGNEKDAEEMQDKIDSYQREEKILEEDLEEERSYSKKLEKERDTLRQAVEKLTHEVQSLKNAVRQ